MKKVSHLPSFFDAVRTTETAKLQIADCLSVLDVETMTDPFARRFFADGLRILFGESSLLTDDEVIGRHHVRLRLKRELK